MANRRPKKGAKRGRASSRSAPTPARRQEAVKPKIPAEGLASILAALGTLVAAFLRASKRRADDLEKSRPNR